MKHFRTTLIVVSLVAAVGLLGCSKSTAKKRAADKSQTTPGADQSQPTAKIEVPTHDCKATPACLEAGYCTQESGSCVVKRNEDCESASVCKRDGKCTATKGQCVVGKEADCEQSKRCKHKGECKFVKGECVTDKQ